MKKFLLLFLPLLFSFSTCGHRGSPLPPLTKDPSTPEVTTLFQDFNRPLLSWKRVKTYRDGRKLPAPQKVKYIVTVNFGKRKLETDKNYIVDLPIKPKEKRCYSVTAVYEGRESSPSEPTCIVGKEPIKEVPRFTAKGEDEKVVIEVENPEYTVEVFRNQKPPFITPYATFAGKEFTDRKVKNGTPYTYRLRFSKGNLKGKLSAPVTVIPQDRTPPLPPPHAYLIEKKVCTVVWDSSPSEDVTYYLVKTEEGEVKVSGIYLTLPFCPKRAEVVAVDKAGNRSKPTVAEVVR